MLLSFDVSNFRCFRDAARLELVASRVAAPKVPRQVTWRDGGAPVAVLPVCGVFGANASGRSTLLHALATARGLVLGSFRSSVPGGRMPYQPFALDGVSATQPTRMAVEVVVNGVRHDYGFEYSATGVERECAYHFPKGKAALLFERDGHSVQIGAAGRAEGRLIARIMRENTLYLSAAGAASYEPLAPLYAWFTQNLLLADSHNRALRRAFTAHLTAWRSLAIGPAVSTPTKPSR